MFVEDEKVFLRHLKHKSTQIYMGKFSLHVDHLCLIDVIRAHKPM